MKKGIKAKDIRDFEKYARKLNEVIERIREYKGSAHIYATPGQLNLMSDDPDDYDWKNGPEVTDVAISALECGDW